jgi:thymidylate kinase
MIIIVEGPDNCGKSTQIKLLRSAFADKHLFHVLHYSNFMKVENVRDISERYYDEMFQIISDTTDFDLILDRSHLGEYVYSPMFRKYDGTYIFELEKKYKIQRRNDVYLIVLIDSPENLVTREDGLSLGISLDHKEAEINAFKEAYEKSIIKNKILINIKDKSVKDVHKEIMSFVRQL